MAEQRRTTQRKASSPRSSAGRKGGQARGRQQRAQSQARRASGAVTEPAERAGVEAKTVAELREALRKNLIRPLDLVMLTRERIEEVLSEAVGRASSSAGASRRTTC